ncbi:MAG: hypothetical protein JXA30_12830 [Deltaproteobacteria bacterium]|nr:hypothetical protein [Deltaproteobacteria bacterium]
MLISRLGSDGTIAIEQDRAQVTRLGKGVDKSGLLDPVAVERTLSTLRDYSTEAKKSRAKIIAVATSVLRDARNREAFVETAERILGETIEIISGRREAELTYVGAIRALYQIGERKNSSRAGSREVTVVDVGGGSTEVIRGAGRRVLETRSIDIGAVRLMERHRLKAPAKRQQIKAIEDEIGHALDTARIDFDEPLIAVGGTATTISAILGEVEPFDAERINGSIISYGELNALCDRLARMSLFERRKITGLEKGRADIIVPGALVLLALQKYAKTDHLMVSIGGVRFGLAIETYRKIAIDLDIDFA